MDKYYEKISNLKLFSEDEQKSNLVVNVINDNRIFVFG